MANVVVVGGANGIGEAVATACAARGDHVFVVDQDEAGAAAVVTKVGGVGSTGCDVADRDAVQRATEAAKLLWGRSIWCSMARRSL